MVIKVIFLDFDGTISNSKNLAYNSMVQALDEQNFKFDKNKLLKLMGSHTRFILRELGQGQNNLNSVRKKFYKYFIEGARVGKIKLCVSIKPLEDLKKDYPLIVISNADSVFLKTSIKRLNLKGLFKKVYGSDNSSLKNELLKKLFKEMKIKPREAIYVGDRYSDIRYAKKAGCYAIAINNKTTWSDLNTMKKENPDYIIKDFRELKKVIEEIRKL